MFFQICDEIISKKKKEMPILACLDKEKLFNYAETNKLPIGKWEKALMKQIKENPNQFISEKKLKMMKTDSTQIRNTINKPQTQYKSPQI